MISAGNGKKIAPCAGSLPKDCRQVGMENGGSAWQEVSPSEWKWSGLENPTPAQLQQIILPRVPRSKYVCSKGDHSAFICKSPVATKLQSFLPAPSQHTSGSSAPDAGVPAPKIKEPVVAPSPPPKKQTLVKISKATPPVKKLLPPAQPPKKENPPATPGCSAGDDLLLLALSFLLGRGLRSNNRQTVPLTFRTSLRQNHGTPPPLPEDPTQIPINAVQRSIFAHYEGDWYSRDTIEIAQLTRAAKRIWESNEGLRNRFPLQNGMLQKRFLQIADAILKRNPNAVDHLNLDFAEGALFQQAWAQEIGPPPGTPRRMPRRASPLQRKAMVQRTASRERIVRMRDHLRTSRETSVANEGGAREFLEGTKGLATTILVGAGLDTAEHFHLITPVQKTIYGVGFTAGIAAFLPTTLPLIATLSAPFQLGFSATQTGLETIGVEPESLPSKIGGWVGGTLAGEGFILAAGKGAGAATLGGAHALGTNIILKGTIEVMTAAATTVAGISAGCWAAGAAPGIALGGAIHYYGIGKAIGTDWLGEKLGDLAFQVIH